MIPEVWDKIETDSLIKVIVDSNNGVSLEEEIKENLTSSIPDKIYGKEYQLVHIPTQSLIQFKEFEKRIKTNCKIIDTCVKVCIKSEEPKLFVLNIYKNKTIGLLIINLNNITIKYKIIY